MESLFECVAVAEQPDEQVVELYEKQPNEYVRMQRSTALGFNRTECCCDGSKQPMRPKICCHSTTLPLFSWLSDRTAFPSDTLWSNAQDFGEEKAHHHFEHNGLAYRIRRKPLGHLAITVGHICIEMEFLALHDQQ